MTHPTSLLSLNRAAWDAEKPIAHLVWLQGIRAVDELIFAGKLSDAQRRRKHWERRIAEEKGDLPSTPSYAAVFKDRPGLDELVRGANIEERA